MQLTIGDKLKAQREFSYWTLQQRLKTYVSI